MIEITRKNKYTWEITAPFKPERDFICDLLRAIMRIKSVSAVDTTHPSPPSPPVAEPELRRQDAPAQRPNCIRIATHWEEFPPSLSSLDQESQMPPENNPEPR